MGAPLAEGPPTKNRYLYLDEHAYWLTRGRMPMLNREHVSVQQQTPTRRRVPEQGSLPV